MHRLHLIIYIAKHPLQKLTGMMTILASALLLSACNDWLDVQPRSQIEDTELFSSESGFKEALSGVYSSMVNSNTYTKELTYGFIGILGQEWNYYYSQSYDDAAAYDYDATIPTGYIRNIWAGNYNSIANVNNLISHIGGNKGLFSRDNHDVIEGEAYALRAFLHFDLLRCFGVSFAVNPEQPSIPYSTALDYHVFPQLTVRQVADAVSADLLTADSLLKGSDPIVTGRTITESTDNGYLLNRQLHLNYYAVKALEARVWLWTGQWQKAIDAAKEVIGSGKFTWSTVANLQAGYDRSLADEQIFALNDLTLKADVADEYFDESSSRSFAVTRERLLDYFDNATQDYRYTFLFKTGTGANAGYRYITKYDDPAGNNSYYRYKIPLIRLPEMYLIMAEAEYNLGETEEALASLNTLRTARNLTALSEQPSDFLLEIIKEYRREFIGEGQLFFAYKRMNRPAILYSDADAIGQKVYTMPLPITETEAAQRNDNK